MSGRATRGPRAEDVLGRVTLVTGKEELLNERTVVAVRDAVRRHDAEAEISETQAAGLTLAELGEMSAPSLFSSTRCVVVRALENLPDESVDGLLEYAAAPADEVALVLVHGGGPKGSGVLAKLRKLAGVTEVKSEEMRASDFPGFVTEEVRHHGATIDKDAATFLVSAVGQDLRSLAAAADQLTNDYPDEALDGREGPQVLRRPGRGQVVRRRRRGVLGAPAGGSRGAALGHRQRHRPGAGHLGVRRLGPRAWPATSPRRGGCARPTWPARSGCRRGSCAPSATSRAAGPTRAIALAIRAVAQADADIKGAASDAAYTLERLVLTITGLRDAPAGD